MPAPRKYPMELRRRAIDEVITRGRKVADVARDLGTNPETLRLWVRLGAARPGSCPRAHERAARACLAHVLLTTGRHPRAQDDTRRHRTTRGRGIRARVQPP